MTEKDLNFEKALTRLEEITAKIESPDTSIEDSIASYKEAVGLIKYCTKTINEAELQVKSVLGGEDDIGRDAQ